MNGEDHRIPPVLPAIGCGTLLAITCLAILLPFILVDAMHQALARLHLPGFSVLPLLLAIFIGSLVNIPLYRIDRQIAQPQYSFGPLTIGAFAPRFRRVRLQTIVAVNLGGCVIPVLIALWQIPYLLASDGSTWSGLVLATIINVVVCHLAARPVRGIGIMMPGFVSPLTAVGMTWLTLAADSPDRASVAFFAGILGPLIGADLLHLRRIQQLAAGMLSIGGAGTFDGIVLSGFVAALLA